MDPIHSHIVKRAIAKDGSAISNVIIALDTYTDGYGVAEAVEAQSTLSTRCVDAQSAIMLYEDRQMRAFGKVIHHLTPEELT